MEKLEKLVNLALSLLKAADINCGFTYYIKCFIVPKLELNKKYVDMEDEHDLLTYAREEYNQLPRDDRFKLDFMYRKHLTEEDKNVGLPVFECSAPCVTTEKRRIQLDHLSQGVIPCTLCDFNGSTTVKEFLTHMICKHEVGQLFACSACSYVFCSKNSFVNHSCSEWTKLKPTLKKVVFTRCQAILACTECGLNMPLKLTSDKAELIKVNSYHNCSNTVILLVYSIGAVEKSELKMKLLPSFLRDISMERLFASTSTQRRCFHGHCGLDFTNDLCFRYHALSHFSSDCWLADYLKNICSFKKLEDIGNLDNVEEVDGYFSIKDGVDLDHTVPVVQICTDNPEVSTESNWKEKCQEFIDAAYADLGLAHGKKISDHIYLDEGEEDEFTNCEWSSFTKAEHTSDDKGKEMQEVLKYSIIFNFGKESPKLNTTPTSVHYCSVCSTIVESIKKIPSHTCKGQRGSKDKHLFSHNMISLRPLPPLPGTKVVCPVAECDYRGCGVQAITRHLMMNHLVQASVDFDSDAPLREGFTLTESIDNLCMHSRRKRKMAKIKNNIRPSTHCKTSKKVHLECPLCTVAFLTEDDLNCHMKLHTRHMELRCRACEPNNVVFDAISTLREHMKIYHSYTKDHELCCRLCSKTIYPRGVFSHFMYSCTKLCSFCDTALTGKDLEKHKREAHPNIFTRFKCGCGATFPDIFSFSNHQCFAILCKLCSQPFISSTNDFIGRHSKSCHQQHAKCTICQENPTIDRRLSTWNDMHYERLPAGKKLLLDPDEHAFFTNVDMYKCKNYVSAAFSAIDRLSRPSTSAKAQPPSSTDNTPLPRSVTSLRSASSSGCSSPAPSTSSATPEPSSLPLPSTSTPSTLPNSTDSPLIPDTPDQLTYTKVQDDSMDLLEEDVEVVESSAREEPTNANISSQDIDVITTEVPKKKTVEVFDLEDDMIIVVDPSSSTSKGRTKDYKCDRCSQAFYTNGRLEAHKRESHNTDVIRLCEADYGVPIGETLYICLLCTTTFQDPKVFADHRRRHVIKHGFCNKCTAVWLYDSGANEHASRHCDSLTYKCLHCKEVVPMFKTETQLMFHIHREHGAQLFFFCKHCFLGSTNAAIVIRHLIQKTCCPTLMARSGDMINVATLGVAPVTILTFQPVDEERHKLELQTNPSKFTIPVLCNFRSFMRSAPAYTTCPDQHAEGEQCFVLTSNFRFDTMMTSVDQNGKEVKKDVPTRDERLSGEHLYPYLRQCFPQEFPPGKRKRNEQMNIPQPPPPPPPQLQHMLIPQQQPPPQQLPGHLLGNPMLHRPPGPPGPPPGASHMIPVHGRLPNVHNLPPNSIPQSVASMLNPRAFVTQGPGMMGGQLQDPRMNYPHMHPQHMMNVPMSMANMRMHPHQMQPPQMHPPQMQPQQMQPPQMQPPQMQPQQVQSSQQAMPPVALTRLVTCNICDTQMAITNVIQLAHSDELFSHIVQEAPPDKRSPLILKFRNMKGNVFICLKHVNPSLLLFTEAGILPNTQNRTPWREIYLSYFDAVKDCLALPNEFERVIREYYACGLRPPDLNNLRNLVSELQRLNICKNMSCGRKTLFTHEEMKLHRLFHGSLHRMACNICYKSFRDDVEAVKHNHSHHCNNARPIVVLQCPLKKCDKMFNESMLLRRHLNKDHMEVFPHHSDYCAAHFVTQRHQVLHDICHRDKQDVNCCYICGEVGTKRSPDEMHSHEMLHAMELKRFCGECFIQLPSHETNLKHFEHFMAAHNQTTEVQNPMTNANFQCRVCGKKMPNASDLPLLHFLSCHRFTLVHPKLETINNSTHLVTRATADILNHLGIPRDLSRFS